MTTVALSPFVPHSSASTANSALKQAIKTMVQAEHCAVLWFQEIHHRRLFRELGYSSIYQYASQELGFSSTKTGDYLALSKNLDTLPELKKELENGRIGYTKAREIVKVANSENEAEWLEEARVSPRRELARKVTQAKKNAAARGRENPDQTQLLARPNLYTPVVAVKHKLTVEMTTEQLARFESLWEKLHKQGAVPAGSAKAEMILEGLAALFDSHESVSTGFTPAVQIHVHKCPECKEATITTSRGKSPLTPKELDRLSCDAQVVESGKPNRATIKPSIRREALSRDQHSCQGPGCRNTRFLEIHHIVPRQLGGTNELKNLITLCSQCHTYLHDRDLRDFCPPAGKSAQKYGAMPDGAK